ncbi:uncharacterized protein Z519_00070 [Cladophialophora bantiana CBS 173.52]|uniref:Uncharacterized protein n=1 Tax=Cladophialophora bantiana (strain ATCC 10958 / CBS 173.52 / CDC B-1940 / NIH 8579) TaxID=1442370 RepID=A0A0D2I558_CLAB1|nr:uncharacterized protein Z519_00070 [Cladophialophora bantiana CBS 173.52]KIW98410.1 hypothetical protein Z519_00070 [Cladophialophora bantiana CBS 173.52]
MYKPICVKHRLSRPSRSFMLLQTLRTLRTFGLCAKRAEALYLIEQKEQQCPDRANCSPSTHILLRVSPKFGVAVRINTADFRRAGIEVNDLLRATSCLTSSQLDLGEISGGSFESSITATAMAQSEMSSRAPKLEAYFLHVAQ